MIGQVYLSRLRSWIKMKIKNGDGERKQTEQRKENDKGGLRKELEVQKEERKTC